MEADPLLQREADDAQLAALSGELFGRVAEHVGGKGEVEVGEERRGPLDERDAAEALRDDEQVEIALGQGLAPGARPENEDQRWPVASFESREVPGSKPPYERISDSTHRAISSAAFTFARAVASS